MNNETMKPIEKSVTVAGVVSSDLLGSVSDDGDTPDQYGNTEKDPFRYCSFPDCGCDGLRLCMAREGANSCAWALNMEKRRASA